MSGSEGSSSVGRWIPLESNPEVLTKWAVAAGLVASQAHFEDIYGLDPDVWFSFNLYHPSLVLTCVQMY